MIYKKLVKNISKSGFAINGEQTDLSNYYNKQEIDTQQNLQNENIAENEKRIDTQTQYINATKSLLEEKIKNNTKQIDQINKDQDKIKNDYVWIDRDQKLHIGNNVSDEIYFKSTFDNDKETQLSIDGLRFMDLANNTTLNISNVGNVIVDKNNTMHPLTYAEPINNFTNDNDIPNKKYVDDLIKNNIKFYAGQIMFFDTKNHFDNFNDNFNLTVNVDYEVIDSGYYLSTGENGAIGGSNTITNDNLPYKEWGMDLSDHYGRYSSYTYFLQPGELKNINMTNFTQSAAGDISYSGGASIERRRFSWNYGTQNPQDFTPKYKMVYAIKFLRNV